MKTPSQAKSAQNSPNPFQNVDFSHRLGLSDDYPLDRQLIDSLGLILDRTETTLELLQLHFESGDDPHLSSRTILSALLTMEAELMDARAVMHSYCQAANAADKEGVAK